MDLDALFASLDRLGIERVVSLELRRQRGAATVWLATPSDDEIAGILGTNVKRLMRIEP